MILVRSLLRMFDLDDARWLITAALAVASFYSWDHAWQTEARLAAVEARIAVLDAAQDDKAPTATTWGNGSMDVDLRAQEPVLTDCTQPAHRRPLWLDGGW